jgi:hypothetical protein
MRRVYVPVSDETVTGSQHSDPKPVTLGTDHQAGFRRILGWSNPKRGRLGVWSDGICVRFASKLELQTPRV